MSRVVTGFCPVLPALRAVSLGAGLSALSNCRKSRRRCTRCLGGAALHRGCTCLWVAQRFTAAI